MAMEELVALHCVVGLSLEGVGKKTNVGSRMCGRRLDKSFQLCNCPNRPNFLIIK